MVERGDPAAVMLGGPVEVGGAGRGFDGGVAVIGGYGVVVEDDAADGAGGLTYAGLGRSLTSADLKDVPATANAAIIHR